MKKKKDNKMRLIKSKKFKGEFILKVKKILESYQMNQKIGELKKYQK